VFVVHVLLVILKQLVLLLAELIWLESYLKTMSRFWRSFDICILALVDCADEVESVSSALFLPDWISGMDITGAA
jgi:hypothetical protein